MKVALIAAAVLVLLAIAAAVAYHLASRKLEDSIIQAFGPNAQVGSTERGFGHMSFKDVQVKAPERWPAEWAMRADRITVTSSLREVVGSQIWISRVEAENGYLSLVRPKSGGLRLLPDSMKRARDRKKAEEAGGPPRKTVQLQVLELRNTTLELYDAKVSPAKPFRLRLEESQATLQDLSFPGLQSRTQLDLKGVVKGPAHKGSFALKGWVEIGAKNSELDSSLRNADMSVYSAYFAGRTPASLSGGVIDLDMHSKVSNNVLHATGTMKVRGLSVKPADSPLEALAALPGKLLLNTMENDKGEIVFKFRLDGPVGEPKLTIEERPGMGGILGFGVDGFLGVFSFAFTGLASGLVSLLGEGAID